MEKNNGENKATLKDFIKVIRMLLIVVIVIAFVVGSIKSKNRNKQLDQVASYVSKAFGGDVEYKKNSNRMIVTVSIANNEEQLLELSKKALVYLAPLGENELLDLLSVRAYYGGNVERSQFYDVKFKDLGRVDWETITNFDQFLNTLSALNN